MSNDKTVSRPKGFYHRKRIHWIAHIISLTAMYFLKFKFGIFVTLYAGGLIWFTTTAFFGILTYNLFKHKESDKWSEKDLKQQHGLTKKELDEYFSYISPRTFALCATNAIIFIYCVNLMGDDAVLPTLVVSFFFTFLPLTAMIPQKWPKLSPVVDAFYSHFEGKDEDLENAFYQKKKMTFAGASSFRSSTSSNFTRSSSTTMQSPGYSSYSSGISSPGRDNSWKH